MDMEIRKDNDSKKEAKENQDKRLAGYAERLKETVKEAKENK